MAKAQMRKDLGFTLVVLCVQHVEDVYKRQDITYGTNNEFGFDYLRDNMVTYKANMVQRGHAYACLLYTSRCV